MEAEQVIVLLKFLFGRTRATAGQPQPVLRWLDQEADTIRQDLDRNDPVKLPGVTNAEVLPTIPDLMKILDYFLHRQPKLTRGFAQKVREMETWLSQQGQRGKMERISTAFPNTLGPAGGVDNLTSFTDFIGEVYAGCKLVTTRMDDGQKWYDDYQAMCLSLSKVRSMLPKVQLCLGDRSELIEESRLLVGFRESFWSKFETWIKRRASDYVGEGQNGLAIIRRLLPDCEELENQTFVDIRATVRNSCLLTMFCYTNTQLINPEYIDNLSDTWRDINGILTKISSLKTSIEDQHQRGVTVLLGDIRDVLDTIGLSRSTFDAGVRQSYIGELDQLMKRLNIFRADGVEVDNTMRTNLFEAKGRLLLDRQLEETATRLEETNAKLKASQANNAAPKLTLMKLANNSDWIGWYLQLSEIVKYITSEQVKAQIVFDSLSDGEDRRFLKGVTQFSQQIAYLKSKYHRPREVTATILARGTAMSRPGTNKKVQKQNILTMLSIKRDLTKLGFVAKLDTFFINLTAVRVFTDPEYELFLRESAKFYAENASQMKEKKKLAKTMAAARVAPTPGVERGPPATSSRLVEPNPGVLPPLDGEDPWEAVDEADIDRDLSGDESDDSTSIFSLCTKVQGPQEDQDVKAYRKFFFSYLTELLALMRTVESMEFASGLKQGGKNKQDGTDCHNTTTGDGDNRCLMDGCGKVHRSAKTKRPSQCLAFCPVFKKLSLNQRFSTAKKLKLCLRCLQPNHQVKDCRMTQLKCRTCSSEAHSTLLCKSADSAGGAKGKAKESADGAAVFTTDTDGKDPEPAGTDTAATTPLPETVSNLASTYDYLETEAYLLSRGGSGVNSTHTCVGLTCVKGKSGSEVRCGTLFDFCSTDAWVTAEFARRVGARRLPDWEGTLRTIEGTKLVKLPAVEIRVFNYESGQYVNLECLVTKSIGTKPQIEQPRFTRLCNAFHIKPSEIDTFSGECHLLIGLKSQSLQIAKVAKFKSEQYPDVGIYQSPLLPKLIFVGAEQPQSISLATTTSIFRCETSDLRLDEFLRSEREVELTDILCETCDKASDCRNCVAARSDSTFREMGEDAVIKNALKVEHVSGEGQNAKYRLNLEYPTYKPLSESYNETNSNRTMAVAASKSLRKKLLKSGKAVEFHAKVLDAATKKHVVEVTDEVAKAHLGLPHSYQLINYVTKESSASTKVRVVTNSSVQRRGGSFNDLCLKGSNLMNSALDILLGFSCYPYCLMTDLSEAYRSIFTGPETNSCRRFFWFKDINDESSLVEMMLVRATYGDKAAGNFLAQGRNIVADDHRVSAFARDFIKRKFFVDDGLTSSQHKQKLLTLAEELPKVFGFYGFQVKHVILSFVQSSGMTLSDSLERCLGIIWNFVTDEFTPALEVFLCRKIRGAHTDDQLKQDMVEPCVPTKRLVLHVVGSLHDITGRHLCPIQVKARIIYARVCAAAKDKGWDDPIECSETVRDVKTLLCDIIKVKSNFLPQSRAWIPPGYKIDMFIGPFDGGIEGFGAATYARSVGDDDEHLGPKCNLAAARAKVSSLDVGDNELLSSLLQARLAEVVVKATPERPPDVKTVLVTDSQCTGHSHSVDFRFTERRRRNSGVRFHRALRRLHTQNDNMVVLLAWLPGIHNPADLISKVHEDVDAAINSTFWRNGSPLYLDKNFPSVEGAIVYGMLKDQVYTHFGFPHSNQHLTECFSCSSSFDSGPMVAKELIQHGQLLCFESETSVTSGQPPTVPTTLCGTSGRDQLFVSARNISSLVGCGVIGMKWRRECREKSAVAMGARPEGRPAISDVIERCRVWTKIVTESQRLYKPMNTMQLLPQITTFGDSTFLATQNRLNAYAVAKYHRTPLGSLPIVSHRDKPLVDLLIKSAHVTETYIEGEQIHLNKSQTITAIRTGFFGCHITRISPLVASFIKKCPTCRRMKAALQPRVISDKFILRYDSPQSGLFSSAGVDILGPYKYKMGPNTRSSKVCKAYVLLVCCQFTSALNSIIMEDYSTKSFVKALETHIAQFRKPTLISCDAGSQFRSISSRTRSHDHEQVSGDASEHPDIFEKAQSVLKDIKFFVASSGAQWQNGLVEANFKQVKLVLRKLTAHFDATNITFKSSFELQRLFQKTCGLLNCRPIFYNEENYVSVKSLTCPGFSTDSLDQILSDVDCNFKTFLEFFDISIIDGSFQRFGGASTSKSDHLKKNDFVLIIYQTQRKRCYGIVQNVPSKHSVEVKILRQKTVGENKEFSQILEKFSTRQVKLIFRPKNDKN